MHTHDQSSSMKVRTCVTIKFLYNTFSRAAKYLNRISYWNSYTLGQHSSKHLRTSNDHHPFPSVLTFSHSPANPFIHSIKLIIKRTSSNNYMSNNEIIKQVGVKFFIRTRVRLKTTSTINTPPCRGSFQSESFCSTAQYLRINSCRIRFYTWVNVRTF